MTSCVNADGVESALTLHPLLQPVILEAIFRQCDWNIQDYKHFRLVCKLWHQATLCQWRKQHATLILHQFGENGDPGMSVTNLLKYHNKEEETLLQLNRTPFSRFRLKNWKFDTGEEKNGKSLEVLQLIFPRMEYLHLENCQFGGNGETLWKILFEWTPNLCEIVLTEVKRSTVGGSDKKENSMEKMSCENLSLRSVQLSGFFPFQWDSRFPFSGRTPNLKKWSVRRNRIGPWDSSSCVIPYNSELTELAIPADFDHDHEGGIFHFLLKAVNVNLNNKFFKIKLHMLPLLNLSLKTLRFQICSKISDVRDLRSLLLKNAVSLQVLKISWATWLWTLEGQGHSQNELLVADNILQSGLQQLEKLRELHLCGNAIGGLSFLRLMPRLEKFVVDMTAHERNEELTRCLTQSGRVDDKFQPRSVDLIQNTLTCHNPEMSHFMNNSLIELHADYQFPVESLTLLQRWMPNLRVLKTLLINDTFPIVCESWPALRELSLLFGSDVDDGAITGFSQTDLPRRPNITNFLYLTKFVLQTYCGQGKLSDSCVPSGFLHVHTLHTLHICVSPEFSKDAEKVLEKKISQVHVFRRHYGQFDHGHDCDSVREFQCCERMRLKKFLSEHNERVERKRRGNLPSQGEKTGQDNQNDNQENQNHSRGSSSSSTNVPLPNNDSPGTGNQNMSRSRRLWQMIRKRL